jgi:hypothetical protein
MVMNSFGNRNFMQPMGRFSKHSKCLGFFSFKFLGAGEDFFFLCSQHVPFKFPMGSRQVPTMFTRFSMCSSRVFPVAPCCNPICFAQSPPLLTYIGGPKEETLHLSIKSSILWSLHSFNFFFFFGRWANQHALGLFAI